MRITTAVKCKQRISDKKLKGVEEHDVNVLFSLVVKKKVNIEGKDFDILRIWEFKEVTEGIRRNVLVNLNECSYY